MLDLSRRGFVVSASAAAAFGLDRSLEFMPSAHAQASGKPMAEAGFHKFKLGDLEVIQLFDGHWEKPHDAAFIKQAGVDETKAALKAAGLTEAHVPIPFTVTVVKLRDGYVMFDSGTGNQVQPTAGRIVKDDLLKAAGIDAAKISTVAVTHFHPDHIFGLMAKDTNAQTFPNAQIVMPAPEYKFWTDPTLVDRTPAPRQGLVKRIQATFPTWKNIKQVEADTEIAPGVRSVAAHGHTPGHMAYVVSSGTQQLLVMSDTANIPALFVKNPGWHAAFDADATMAEATRRRMFDRAIADKAIVTGYHFGVPGAGTIAKDGGGYVFKPVT